MELAFESKRTEFWQPLPQGTLMQEETAELAVPDSCPDLERIVECWAQVLLRGKDCGTGSVSVTGAIQAGIVFLAQGESEPRQLECYIPFTCRWERQELTADCFTEYQSRVKRVDARIVSSRKALLRVNLISDFQGWRPETCEIPELKEPPRELQLRTRDYLLSRTVDTAERPLLLQEEIELPAGQPAVQQLLCWSVRPVLQEQKLSGGRIAFRGVLELRTLYLAEDARLISWGTEVPFSQLAEMNRSWQEASPELCLQVTGRDLELSDTRRRFALQVNLLAQCRVTMLQSVRLLEDLFGTEQIVTPRMELLRETVCLDSRRMQQLLREVVPVPAAQVEHIQAFPGRPEQQRGEAGPELQVPVELQILYRDETGALQSGTAQLHASFAAEAAEQCAITLQPRVTELFAAPAAGGVEVRCSVEAELRVWCTQEKSYVAGAECRERRQEPDRPSVVIRRVAAGEDLWQIAKANLTSVERICRANGVTEEETAEGTLLLIPLR